MVEKSPCSGCERRMTESIRKGRCSYFCKECGYDKSLSDIYWAEATCNTGEKNNGL